LLRVTLTQKSQMTNDVKRYRTKGIWHLEAAQDAEDSCRGRAHVALALSYLRLAEMAEKNAMADIVSETPSTKKDDADQPAQT
jgi:hypothetical protein